jgi:hypothetical protein
MKAHIEGLNLEITMLQIELDPQQEPYSSNASFNNWEQGCPEKALAPFDSRSDTFGFHTSLDFSTGQSSMEAVLDQHSGVSTSKVKRVRKDGHKAAIAKSQDLRHDAGANPRSSLPV